MRRLALTLALCSIAIVAWAQTLPLTGAGHTATAGPTSVVLQSSSTSTTTTITAPAAINAGDLLVIVNFAQSGTVPTTLTPTGFTLIKDSLSGSRRMVTSFKKAAGTESSSTIGLMTGSVTASDNIMAVFRGNIAFTTLTPLSEAAAASVGPPSNQVVTSSGGTPPLVVLGFFASNSAITRTLSPAATAELSETATNNVYLDYKLYNSSPADVTVSMTGTTNFWMQSLYITGS